jgi:hypothetical protein
MFSETLVFSQETTQRDNRGLEIEANALRNIGVQPRHYTTRQSRYGGNMFSETLVFSEETTQRDNRGLEIETTCPQKGWCAVKTLHDATTEGWRWKQHALRNDRIQPEDYTTRKCKKPQSRNLQLLY